MYGLLQDIIVLCLDVGPSMDLTPLDAGETALEKALRVARQITQQKVFLVFMVEGFVPDAVHVCRCLQVARICWAWCFLELQVT